MKVLINATYGGYGLSKEAVLRYCELKDIKVWPDETEPSFGPITYYLLPPDERQSEIDTKDWLKLSLEERIKYNKIYSEQTFNSREDISRHDPVLIQVFEELQATCAGPYCNLKVVEIPDGVDYVIEEYDGKEWIAEVHRTWS